MKPRAALAHPTAVAIFVTAVACLVLGCGNSGGSRPAGGKVSDKVAWLDPAIALAQAKSTGKPLMYEFSADWCVPCKIMAREVFADDESARWINASLVPVRIVDRSEEDGRNAPAVQQLLDKYGITGFPALIVVAPDGSNRHTQVGYNGKEQTRRFLEVAERETARPVH